MSARTHHNWHDKALIGASMIEEAQGLREKRDAIMQTYSLQSSRCAASIREK